MINLVFTVGQYTLVSMALNTLGVPLDEGLGGSRGGADEARRKSRDRGRRGPDAGRDVGNGRATAILFAREGAHVVVWIATWPARATPRRRDPRGGRRGAAFEADVTREADCRRSLPRRGRAATDGSTFSTTTSASAPATRARRTLTEAWDRIMT